MDLLVSKQPELASADRFRNGKGVTSEQIDLVESQRRAELRPPLSPEAFVSKLFKSGIHVGVPKHNDVTTLPVR